MNKVILMGRLARDAEARYSQGKKTTSVARFSFAVPRKFKRDNEPDCDFINCVAFGKQADFIEKYTYKGIKLLIEGRIQTGSYTNRDGQKVYTTDVVVESCEFAESKNASQSERPQQQAQTQPSVDEGGWMNIPDGIDSELPFS